MAYPPHAVEVSEEVEEEMQEEEGEEGVSEEIEAPKKKKASKGGKASKKGSGSKKASNKKSKSKAPEIELHRPESFEVSLCSCWRPHFSGSYLRHQKFLFGLVIFDLVGFIVALASQSSAYAGAASSGVFWIIFVSLAHSLAILLALFTGLVGRFRVMFVAFAVYCLSVMTGYASQYVTACAEVTVVVVGFSVQKVSNCPTDLAFVVVGLSIMMACKIVYLVILPFKGILRERTSSGRSGDVSHSVEASHSVEVSEA